MSKSVAVLALLLVAGCETMHDSVVRQVSFIRDCPPERIRVTKSSPDERLVEVWACGQTRKFEDMATHSTTDLQPRWVDVTPK